MVLALQLARKAESHELSNIKALDHKKKDVRRPQKARVLQRILVTPSLPRWVREREGGEGKKRGNPSEGRKKTETAREGIKKRAERIEPLKGTAEGRLPKEFSLMGGIFLALNAEEILSSESLNNKSP